VITSGAVIEVLTSPRGTWTIIVTTADGVTCALASGNSWQEVPTLASKGDGA